MEQQKKQCRHCWEIESSRMPTAKGVCKLCGEERVFTENSNPYISFREYMKEQVLTMREQKKAEDAKNGVFE